ncbi:MAG: SET domain-containing protein [Xanthomonadales bacterium]|nr:SET domain-containing protein [Xanthomonadales bacterium]
MTATFPNARVYVAPSTIHGQGLFARQALPAGQFIGHYEGPRVEADGMHVLWVQEEIDGEWTAYDGHNEMRYLNHADRPNAEMDGLDCYALVDIPADAEITIDYGWNDS